MSAPGQWQTATEPVQSQQTAPIGPWQTEVRPTTPDERLIEDTQVLRGRVAGAANEIGAMLPAGFVLDPPYRQLNGNAMAVLDPAVGRFARNLMYAPQANLR
jgi:hypothetical protein